MTLPTSDAPEAKRPDYELTVFRLASIDFPWDIERALEFALFRTYAVPSISGLLAKTGEFENRTRKRYDDTELIMAEMAENGLDSDRGQAALARMNAMHGSYRIANSDMVYVLSTFVLEPMRWIARFGWRQLTEAEKQDILKYYQDLGARMGIDDVPKTVTEFDSFNRQYERDQFRYAESNAKIARSTMDLMLGFYAPRALWPLGRPVMRALMDPPLLDAMGLDPAPRWLQWAVNAGLRSRAGFLRVLPKRKRPHLITHVRRPTYPQGYKVADLGTFPADAS